ncbi:hypothetical protein Tco_0227241 [Tanacetum coccineum]
MEFSIDNKDDEVFSSCASLNPTSDSTLPKESSEIATFLSSPFGNKDKHVRNREYRYRLSILSGVFSADYVPAENCISFPLISAFIGAAASGSNLTILELANLKSGRDLAKKLKKLINSSMSTSNSLQLGDLKRTGWGDQQFHPSNTDRTYTQPIHSLDNRGNDRSVNQNTMHSCDSSSRPRRNTSHLCRLSQTFARGSDVEDQIHHRILILSLVNSKAASVPAGVGSLIICTAGRVWTCSTLLLAQSNPSGCKKEQPATFFLTGDAVLLGDPSTDNVQRRHFKFGWWRLDKYQEKATKRHIKA